eukprot:CAMPEP_0181170392 /NCGR_PEP_ID=MMETSP1096-20121128/1339_2 /TAXON_ID=156174 ORGANISM="Chrysochromulina ericina, Strain CCMP281" /NCGR_SAMPLE_ID=MMETSP1096 /ASSEMBLY_ACC=CAM_ASM_000453 /LENGTH=193 /DNA_ID=CAMNT_0023257945 /DNA_START=112 /DNA_END=693 /DNA_ORIENTATION=-
MPPATSISARTSGPCRRHATWLHQTSRTRQDGCRSTSGSSHQNPHVAGAFCSHVGVVIRNAFRHREAVKEFPTAQVRIEESMRAATTTEPIYPGFAIALAPFCHPTVNTNHNGCEPGGALHTHAALLQAVCDETLRLRKLATEILPSCIAPLQSLGHLDEESGGEGTRYDRGMVGKHVVDGVATLVRSRHRDV